MEQEYVHLTDKMDPEMDPDVKHKRICRLSLLRLSSRYKTYLSNVFKLST